MSKRARLFLCASLLLLSGCEAERNKLNNFLHLPNASEFSDWFQWFIELFTPDRLTNKEKIVFTLLVCIALGALLAFLNSRRILMFFKEPPTKNRFLRMLLIEPSFLSVSFRYVQHPGWAVGIWTFLRSVFLVTLFVLLFVLLFYTITVVLPIAIFIAVVLFLLYIIISITES